MSGRRFNKPSMALENPIGSPGKQVINTMVAVTELNMGFNEIDSKPFYPGTPMVGMPAGSAKDAAQREKLGFDDHMAVTKGQIVLMMRKGINNDRWKAQTGNPANISVEAFATLAHLKRTSDAPFTEKQAEFEAMVLTSRLQFVGICIPPDSKQDNSTRFMTQVAGNLSVALNGRDPAAAGDLLALQVPAPHQLKAGYIKDEKLPLPWLVPVDRAKWDLEYKPHFVAIALHHFDDGGSAEGAADMKRGIRLGAVAIRAYWAKNGLTHKARQAEMNTKMMEYIPGLEPYDVAVVEILLYQSLGTSDAGRVQNKTVAEVTAAVEVFRGADGRTVVDTAFNAMADNGLLRALRGVIMHHDKRIVAKAFTSARPGEEVILRIGHYGAV